MTIIANEPELLKKKNNIDVMEATQGKPSCMEAMVILQQMPKMFLTTSSCRTRAKKTGQAGISFLKTT